MKKCLRYYSLVLLVQLVAAAVSSVKGQSWIRINQLGYPCKANKTAVWVSKTSNQPSVFELINALSGVVVYSAGTGKAYGAYGPFVQTLRLGFTAFEIPGKYFLRCGKTASPVFTISDAVYRGMADYPLHYMRQQRSGYNPFLQDSCHTGDGYTMYGPMPDTTHIDVAGGWHDATDYLQYASTSANATYHMLAAYRDFPGVFGDTHSANGLAGSNREPDILDEARWGLAWLQKMHPREDWLFTQLADDRDHTGFRLPNHDSVDYGLGKGKGRPVYFANGQPQGLGQYKNHTTGVASAAGKFASAFALGAILFRHKDTSLSALLKAKAMSAYQLGLNKPGVCQTAPNKAPYFYEEDNWVDDMELAAADLYTLTGNSSFLSQSLAYSLQEPVTPWMGADTAKHYQWYPFHNFGHYELAANEDRKNKELLINYYKEGITRVWKKATQNAFYRGVPFIWCSNNLTVSFTIQCYLYRTLSGSNEYVALEQAGFDWLFGCNPWGTSMVYGLPATGNTPKHPHSSLSLLNHYDLDGALVDGPVYGSIYNHLRGISLYNADAYAEWQSDLVVYHDDAGDYSTNEPTMDGTASLIYLLAQKEYEVQKAPGDTSLLTDHGAIIRGNSKRRNLALVFTGDEFGDGATAITNTLNKEKVKASFFLTGNFYRNKKFNSIISELKKQGHYLGTHSDNHLLYCDWNKRDSLLLTKEQFNSDLSQAYHELNKKSISKAMAHYFLPPYEWYNDSIAAWTTAKGLQLICYSPGTRSNADYTFPQMGNSYVDSKTIFQSVVTYEQQSSQGLNGFILLLHIGTDPRRTDKFYTYLPALITELKKRGYHFSRIDQLLK